MKDIQLLIAGFGGQGVLFAGKLLAYMGLIEEQQVSWLPSYGPEMRGGTANCSVIISSAPVGSPIVSEPVQLIAMNLPSLEKYQPLTVAGGCILYDSYLIRDVTLREDVKTIAIPATKLAADAGLSGLANMVMMGKFLAEVRPESFGRIDEALEHLVPARKAHLIESNRKALEIGRTYGG